MRRIVYITLLVALMGQTLAWAQKDAGSFFSNMGHSDGVSEQLVHFSAEQDELDYWNDQRAFEQALLRQKPDAFGLYMEAKHNVYAAHQPLCDAQCDHGDYYWLQASYYIQFGPDKLDAYTSAGKEGSLPVGKRQ